MNNDMNINSDNINMNTATATLQPTLQHFLHEMGWEIDLDDSLLDAFPDEFISALRRNRYRLEEHTCWASVWGHLIWGLPGNGEVGTDL